MSNNNEKINFFLRKTSFVFLLIIVALAIIYSDDQLDENRLAFIYRYKFLALDIFDYLLIILALLCFIIIIFKMTIVFNTYHYAINLVFITYLISSIIGYIYGWFFEYSLVRWLQEMQPILYFCIIFYAINLLITSKKEWNILYWLLIVLTGILNIVFLQRFFFGIGNISDVKILTATGLDVLILAFNFYPLIAFLFFEKNEWYIKLFCFIMVLIYLFNIILNSGRTIWAVFLLSIFYLIINFSKKARWKLIALITATSFLFLILIASIFPTFLTYAQWRLESIVDFSKTHTNLSNATRTVEIQNILHRIFNYGSPFFGMGIGAYWVDDEYSLLYGDTASGFVGKQKYYHTHLLIITQFLKIGIIGVIVFYGSMFFFYRSTKYLLDRIEIKYYRFMVLALIIIFFNLVFSMMETQRFMFFLGLTIALMAKINILFNKNSNEIYSASNKK